jgi:hypothetical protein
VDGRAKPGHDGGGTAVEVILAHAASSATAALIVGDVVDLERAGVRIADDMSFVPRLEKLPKRPTCQSRPTVPSAAMLVIWL